MEAFPSLTLGLPLGSCSDSILQWLASFLVYHKPSGVRVGPFATFHLPIVELYFPSMTWLGIGGIVRLIKFSLQMAL